MSRHTIIPNRVWVSDTERTERSILARMKTRTLYADLGCVFKGGSSELLNGIARLAVLYEDLRIEIAELRRLQHEHDKKVSELPEYRVIYFLRRALTSVFEFRRGLTLVRKSDGFKQAEARLSETDRDSIAFADTYLQQHWPQVKDFRNEFGAHMQAAGVKFATANLDGTIGGITWNFASDGLPMGLECDFAGQIVVGAMMSKLPTSTDMKDEAQKALQIIIESFVPVQAAMCGLVHAFLWDRFGT